MEFDGKKNRQVTIACCQPYYWVWGQGKAVTASGPLLTEIPHSIVASVIVEKKKILLLLTIPSCQYQSTFRNEISKFGIQIVFLSSRAVLTSELWRSRICFTGKFHKRMFVLLRLHRKEELTNWMPEKAYWHSFLGHYLPHKDENLNKDTRETVWCYWTVRDM